MKIRQNLLLTAAATGLLTSSALAAGTGTPQLEEVIVTAQRRAENLQHTPVSVTSLSSKTLDQLNITTPDKISLLVPNVSIAPGSGGIGGNSAFIRGIGQQDPLLTIDSGVGQYLDGVYLGRISGNNLDLLDIARIEVLRGPQGTLYGRNTTGGAINTVTRTPDQAFSVDEKVGYGSYNDWYSRTRVETGELGSSGLTASLSYLHHARDGYADTPNTKPADRPGALDTNAVFAKIHGAWDQLTLDLTADYDKDRGQREPFQVTAPYPGAAYYYASSPQYGGAPFVTSPNFISNRPLQYPGADRNQVAGVAATLQYTVSPALILKSITAARSWQASQSTTYAGDLMGPVVNFSSPTLYSIEAVSPFLGVQKVRQSQFSQELQVLGTSGEFNYVAGLYFFREHVAEYNPNFFTVALPPAYLGALGFPAIIGTVLSEEGLPSVGVNLGQLLKYSGTSSSAAAYSQTTYRPAALDNKFSITAGLRGTYDHRSLDQPSIPSASLQSGSFSDFNNLTAPVGASRQGEVSYRNIAFAGSADYQWTTDINSYARVASGYKSGGFDARAGYNPAVGTSFPYEFKPERVLSYEVGAKTEWLDQRLRANGALFYTDFRDQQVATYTGANGFTPNANSTMKGGEIELIATPLEGLRFDADWGYTDAQYSQFLLVNPATGVIGNYAASSHFPYVPRNSVHVGGQYSFPCANIGTLTLRTDFTHTSARYFFPNTLLDPANDLIRDPGQDLLSARVILSDVTIGRSQVTFQVFGDNLLNVQRRDSAIDFGSSIGIAGDSFGEPRSFGVSADTHF